ncbi:MAG: lactate utilization protein, partial [Clostridia bacterium]|nr:lactate utilization protein [Clostridia bacterium]
IYRAVFSADAFITSTNAITENGELYNVDGNSNRVSAMLFGPERVIVVAGYNKIVADINDAIKRVKTIAAPINSARLGVETPCTKTGKCVSLAKANPEICDGCASDARICANYTIMSRQKRSDRVYVILVGEELGF